MMDGIGDNAARRSTLTLRSPIKAPIKPKCQICLKEDLDTAIRKGDGWECENCAAKNTASAQTGTLSKVKTCARCNNQVKAEHTKKVNSDSHGPCYYCLSCIEANKRKREKKVEQARLEAERLEAERAKSGAIGLGPDLVKEKQLPTPSAEVLPNATVGELVTNLPQDIACCYGCGLEYPRSSLRLIRTKDNTNLVCQRCVDDYKQYELLELNSSNPFGPFTNLPTTSPVLTRSNQQPVENSSYSSEGNRSNLSRISAQRRQKEEEFNLLLRKQKAQELMSTINAEEEELKRLLEETQLKKRSLQKLYNETDDTRAEARLTTERLEGVGGASMTSARRNATIQEWISGVSISEPTLHRRYKEPTLSKIDRGIRWEDLANLDGTIFVEPRDKITQNNMFHDLDTTVNRLGTEAVAKVRTLLPEQIVARKYLPKELPTFSGDPAEWPKFLSAFVESQAHCNYSDRENLMRLRPALKGEAYKLVEDLLNYPENLDCVMSSLKAMFGNPERIRQAISRKIKALPSIKADDLSSITWMANKVKGICSTLRAAQLERDLFNCDYLAEIEEKMPVHLRISWGMFKAKQVDCNLSTIAAWLSTVGEATVTLGRHTNRSPERTIRRPERVHSHTEITEATTRKPSCEKCSGSHSLTECGDFKDLGVEDRWNLAVSRRLCFRCLKPHNFVHCPVRTVCGTDGCNRKHHKLLHQDKNKNNTGTVTEQTVAHHRDETSDVLFRIVPVRLYGPDRHQDTFAFLDEGSSVTLIEQDLAEQLNVSGPAEKLCLRWTNSTTRTEDSSRVSIGISCPSEEKRVMTMSGVRTVKSLDLPEQTLMKVTAKEFRNLPIPLYRQAKPRILVGLTHWKLALPLEQRSTEDGLFAIRSKLGWAVSGTTRTPATERTHFHECGCLEAEEMNNSLQQYFKMECEGLISPEKTIESKEITRAKNILQKTTKKIGERYEVGLLWRNDDIQLPDSKPMALRRHLCLEKKLSSDPPLYAEVRKQMSDYITKGYSRILSQDEELDKGPKTWYLPIFAVKNVNKPEKTRIVWDAAAKVKDVALNDMLLPGPDLLCSLADILRRFREYKIGLTGDITEMFHQVQIRKEDQDSQRFLWRDFPTEPLRTMVMKVMTFGATCSPCASQYVKNTNADAYRLRHPEAVFDIKQNHYVDDYVASYKDEETAKRVAHEVRYIQGKAGYNLGKFASNSEEVLSNLETDIKPTKNLLLGVKSESKVLGLCWDMRKDALFFKINWTRMDDKLAQGLRLPTKRELLSHLMSVYDPLGLIAHLLIQLKLLLQDVHRYSNEWDQQIPATHAKRWEWWLNAVDKLDQIEIPRCYSILLSTEKPLTELHIFVDASERVYAAVAYLRIINKEDTNVTLIGGKTKLAPTKLMSIPRLELQAAVLGVRLAKSIIDAHRIPFTRKVFWSDSQNVLAWLRNEPRNFKPFVAFRVGEILDATCVTEWHHVPSKQNAADICTKLQSHVDVNQQGTWFQGPAFLSKDESNWPTTPSRLPESETQELRNNINIHIQEPTVHRSTASPDASRIKKWTVLVRCQARVLQWLRNERRPVNTEISPDEFQEAELELIRTCQREVYSREIEILKRDNDAPLLESSTLRNLTPFYDHTDGILKMGSRIQRATVVFTQKNPIILPKGHSLTRCLLWDYHRKFQHAFQETICNEVRQRFYIPHLRIEIKTVANKCSLCIIKRSKPRPPKMADLPTARLAVNTRPFTYTGLDYFGPILVKVRKSTQKYWGVLMTCMTTRACHLDITSSLSSDHAIMVIERFIARRGEPLEILCDNATTFRGIDTTLDRETSLTDWSVLGEKYYRVKFVYNPPAAPHMGGCWERMIRSVKSTLKTILKTQQPTVEVLSTALAQIEGILNSRPLTYMPISEDAVEALTPNHLLIGQSSTSRPMTQPPCRDVPFTKQFHSASFIAQAFWARWVKEYLPTLLRRTKWFDPAPPIKVGDVGVIWDTGIKNSWRLGRVVAICESKRDGQVRVVEIQTAKGIYRRPVSRFAKFDIERGEQPENSQVAHNGGNVEEAEIDELNTGFLESSDN